MTAGTSTSSEEEVRTVGIDTSILVSGFDRRDPRHREAIELFNALREGRLRARISTVAAAELLVGPMRKGWTDRVLMIQAFLLRLPNVALLPPSWSIAFEAARIRAGHQIQLPDAIIIASALVCDLFASADKRALAVAEAEGIEAMSF